MALLIAVTVGLPATAGAAGSGGVPAKAASCVPSKAATEQGSIHLGASLPYAERKVRGPALVTATARFEDRLLTVPKIEKSSQGSTACRVSYRRDATNNSVTATFYVPFQHLGVFKILSAEVHPGDAGAPILGAKLLGEPGISS